MFVGHRLTVRHPSGVKVEMPLKSLSEYTRSVIAWKRFTWKAKKTAKALETVHRLSLEALCAYEKITSPYATLGEDLQESFPPRPHPGEDRPSGAVFDSEDK